MSVEANKEIRRAVDTGKIVFGYRQCQKKLLAGEGEMVIASKNMPKNEKETLKQIALVENKKFYEYLDTGLALGSVCGKPFVVSTMMILEAGKSKVLEI
ncbi:MAG: 50S ribosomal protein L30e [Candidatus Diapherotrites archaeon]|nr:50S ribosomal protein L30e [Candidatus Diapherotrites archaeon]